MYCKVTINKCKSTNRLKDSYQDDFFGEDLSQKEQADLSKALEMSRISAERESAQRTKQKFYDFRDEYNRGNTSKTDEIKELSFSNKFTQNSPIREENEDTQLSGSQPLFDSSKEEDNSINGELHSSGTNGIEDDLPGTWGKHKTYLHTNKRKILEQVASKFTKKIRRISESSESSIRSSSPVFGHERNAACEKRLLNLRRKNTEVIMANGIFYAPSGANLKDYTVHIINLFNKYEIDLRNFQSRSFNRIEWPKPVPVGLRHPNSLDLRRRGEKLTLDIEDEEMSQNAKDKTSYNMDKENDSIRTVVTRYYHKSALNLKLIEDVELPDLDVNLSQSTLEADNSSQEFVKGTQSLQLSQKFSKKSQKNFSLTQETNSQTSTAVDYCSQKIDKKNKCNVETTILEISQDCNFAEIESCSSSEEHATGITKSSQTVNSSQISKNCELFDSDFKNSPKRKSPSPQPISSPFQVVQDIACPMCNVMFGLEDIEAHASDCQGPTINRRLREMKNSKSKGLPMERILQEIQADPSDLPETNLTKAAIPGKRRANNSAAILNNFKPLKLQESLERCYVCGRFFSEGKPYQEHVEHCIMSASSSSKSSDPLKSPTTKNNLKLLKQLENNATGDHMPSVKKREHVRSCFRFSFDLSDSDSNASNIVVNNSPIKSFCAISEQQDNLINFSQQFTSKPKKVKAIKKATKKRGRKKKV